MQETRESEPSSTTLVVCDDDGTLLRLRDYLVRVGFSVLATRSLEHAWREAQRCAALVLMADDFDTGEVAAGLLRMLATPPNPFVIIVSSMRQQFEAVALFERPGSLVIIPKPAWGWTIVDLLRGRGREA